MSLKRRIESLELQEADLRRDAKLFVSHIQAALASPDFPEENKARMLELFEIASRRRDALQP